MHRFYLPREQTQSPTLTLTEGEAHHAAQVLRVQNGEKLTILNGAGYEFLCKVESVSKKTVSLSVLEKNFTAALPYSVTLLQAIPKGKMMEWVIEKATELGVVRIVPLLTERVVVHLDKEGIEEKRQKWQQVAIEAIKQCGQPWLPKVEAPITLKEFLTRGEKPELHLVGSLQLGSQHPRIFFDAFSKTQKRPPQSVSIFVGPEGDFSAEEIQKILVSGAHPITLGRLILRCETAAIYCLSLANYELTAT